MHTDRHRVRRLAVVLGSIAVLATGLALARGSSASTDSGPRAGSGPLPGALSGTHRAPASAPVSLADLPPADRAAVVAQSKQHHRLTPPANPGVPVSLDISIPTPAHPDGVHARVTAHRLNPDGTLFVPNNPRTVSWARQDAAPGATHGTIILTSHINYVINGHLVIGALADLAWYAQHAVGKKLTVGLADGRTLTYRIVAGREYTKSQLAASPKLRATLYDQQSAFGPTARPSSRLLLVSCGGAFDPYSGEYEDNVFLYALPVF